jgi:hypothetical protein
MASDLSRFREGGIVYHKATGKRCVVISIINSEKVKVRTADDLEREYYPQELETEEEQKARYEAYTREVNDLQKDNWSKYGY